MQERDQKCVDRRIKDSAIQSFSHDQNDHDLKDQQNDGTRHIANQRNDSWKRDDKQKNGQRFIISELKYNRKKSRPIRHEIDSFIKARKVS